MPKDKHRKKKRVFRKAPRRKSKNEREVIKHQKTQLRQQSLEGLWRRQRPDPAFISGFSVSCCGYCGIEGNVGYIGNLWRKILEKTRRKGRNREKIEGDRESDRSEWWQEQKAYGQQGGRKRTLIKIIMWQFWSSTHKFRYTGKSNHVNFPLFQGPVQRFPWPLLCPSL